MGKPTGFMEYARRSAAERSPSERIRDWRDLYLPLSEDELRAQGARCMDCAVPFCQTGDVFGGMTAGCPVRNLIPEWNDLVYRGRWREALDLLLSTNNFPEFTGRACPAPCEGSCVAALYDEPVAIKTIERAIIDRGFEEGWMAPKPPEKRTGKRVAVVGSGPAGLAAADELNKRGHSVTVFERDDRIGGLLTYGIPKMKIEQDVVDRRVRLMEAEGIRFVTGAEVGKTVPVDELKRAFDAVVLCTGATKPRDLAVAGRGLAGVHFAMEYLAASTKSLLDGGTEPDGALSARDKNVIVIGGGDTATDCVATAIRQGCRSVVQFDLYPRKPAERAAGNPWPEWPLVYKLDYGQKEAKALFGRDPRAFAVGTKSFEDDGNGRLAAVTTVDLLVRRENGRNVFEEIPGTERRWPADLVLIAIGFSGPEQELPKQLGVAVDARSNIAAGYGSYATNVDGVFAAGDARRGQSLIVWAIHEGREAAKAVDRYLAGGGSLRQAAGGRADAAQGNHQRADDRGHERHAAG